LFRLYQNQLIDLSGIIKFDKKKVEKNYFYQGRWVYFLDWSSKLNAWNKEILGNIFLSEFPKGPLWKPTAVPIKGTSTVWCVPANSRFFEIGKKALKKIQDKNLIKKMEIEFGTTFPAHTSLLNDKDLLKQYPHLHYGSTLLSEKKSFLIPKKNRFQYNLEECFREYLIKGLSVEDWFSFLDKTNLSEYQPSSPQILKAIQFMEEQFSKIENIQDVWKAVNLSSTYFRKLFKNETGYTCEAFLKMIRMEKAKELLVKGELSVKEVCFQTGFHSPEHFSRTFQKYWGESPNNYRVGKPKN